MSDAAALAAARCQVAEGFRPHKYLDTRGFETIGFGMNIDAGVSEHLAAAILAVQVADAEADA